MIVYAIRATALALGACTMTALIVVLIASLRVHDDRRGSKSSTVMFGVSCLLLLGVSIVLITERLRSHAAFSGYSIAFILACVLMILVIGQYFRLQGKDRRRKTNRRK